MGYNTQNLSNKSLGHKESWRKFLKFSRKRKNLKEIKSTARVILGNSYEFSGKTIFGGSKKCANL